MREISIKNPQLFELTSPEGKACFGGHQDWYDEHWNQVAGCGPVAASNLVWYHAHAHGELRCLCGAPGKSFEDYRQVMDKMFEFITPGYGGIYNSGLFMPGLLEYCKALGAPMECDNLEIPKWPRRRPGVKKLREFLVRWLETDNPVAFLNLSNGAVKLPDSWHWTTIYALEVDKMTVKISDEGRTYETDIAKWLLTSKLGGAFVALHKA